MTGSAFEWTACAIAAAAVIVSIRKGRAWLMVGILAVLLGWLGGSARALFLPAVLGILTLLLLWKKVRPWRSTGVVVALGGIFGSALLCWLFPLPLLPKLSGSYPVGTLSFELPATGPSPTLIAQVWYPAQEDRTAPFAPWLADPELAPRFPFHRIGQALARSQTGLELSYAQARFPVIFYEHAWNGHRQENVAQVEELASQGFVVIAVDHPGQAGRVAYQNGTVVRTRLPASFEMTTETEVDEFEKLAETCLDERIRDVRHFKQALATCGPEALAGRLLLDQVGVFGFSFGGTTAFRLCAVDSSFSAGANEDGMVLGPQLPQGPFLFINEQIPARLTEQPRPNEGAEDTQTRRSETRIVRAMEKTERFRVTLDGTLHPAFTDRIFTCRVPWLARVGTRPPTEVHQTISNQLNAFFKRELPLPNHG